MISVTGFFALNTDNPVPRVSLLIFYSPALGEGKKKNPGNEPEIRFVL